jgi:hypothetical protein
MNPDGPQTPGPTERRHDTEAVADLTASWASVDR